MAVHTGHERNIAFAAPTLPTHRNLGDPEAMVPRAPAAAGGSIAEAGNGGAPPAAVPGQDRDRSSLRTVRGRPPRVALDCRGLHWLGIGRYCRELAAALPRVAPDLEFLWLCTREGAPALASMPAGRTVVVATRPLSVGEQVEVPLALARHGVDLFHAPNSYTHPLLAGRLVVTVHDLILTRYRANLRNPAGRAYYDFMTHMAVSRAARILTVSRFTADDVASLWAGVSARLRPVWNGVSDRFRPVHDRAVLERTREACGLPGRFILYLGSCKPHKNLPRLIEAYGGLSTTERSDHPLVLVARRDPRYPEIERSIADLGLESDVLWRPGIAEEHLAALYSLAEFLIMPSLYEGFGFPLAEAMACGTAVLAARAASLPEVGGDACDYVDPLSANAIRAGLRRMIHQPAHRDELSRRGLERSRAFSWEETARQVAAVYREALG